MKEGTTICQHGTPTDLPCRFCKEIEPKYEASTEPLSDEEIEKAADKDCYGCEGDTNARFHGFIAGARFAQGRASRELVEALSDLADDLETLFHAYQITIRIEEWKEFDGRQRLKSMLDDARRVLAKFKGVAE